MTRRRKKNSDSERQIKFLMNFGISVSCSGFKPELFFPEILSVAFEWKGQTHFEIRKRRGNWKLIWTRNRAGPILR